MAKKSFLSRMFSSQTCNSFAAFHKKICVEVEATKLDVWSYYPQDVLLKEIL